MHIHNSCTFITHKYACEEHYVLLNIITLSGNSFPYLHYISTFLIINLGILCNRYHLNFFHHAYLFYSCVFITACYAHHSPALLFMAHQLDISVNVPDVLGISQNAVCPESSCERALATVGSVPCEHQLDLLVVSV